MRLFFFSWLLCLISKVTFYYSVAENFIFIYLISKKNKYFNEFNVKFELLRNIISFIKF